jgi:predicted RNase H-like HicB family nuclease
LRPARFCRATLGARLLGPLGEVALELGHGDQASTPLGLDRGDHRDDPPDERRQADAERLGGLLTRVGEPVDILGKLQPAGASRVLPLGVTTLGLAREGSTSGTIRRYGILVEWDPSARVWVTFVPSLDSLSTYGKTRESALEQTREAILGYLEAAAKEGLPVPEADAEPEVVEVEVATR